MTKSKRSVPVFAVAALAATAGCDAFGPEDRPPATLTSATTAYETRVGETLDITVQVDDARGAPIPGATVTWTPSTGTTVDPASGTTDDRGEASTRWDIGTTAGEHTLTAAAGDVQLTLEAAARPARLDRIVIHQSDHTFEAIGDTLVLTASGEDRYGNTVETGRLSWFTSDSTVATVEEGVVVSRGAGTTDIAAGRRGFPSAAVQVEVDPVTVGLGIAPAEPVLVVGETTPLLARPVDARGTPVDTSVSVTWSSSDETVATVDDAGTMEAVGIGTAVISAAAPPLAGEAAVEVKAGPRPAISAIQPAVLTGGDTATITGTDFSTDPALNSVTIWGNTALVLAASPTSLTVRLPDATVFPCEPAADRDVTVTVDRLAATARHPVAGGLRHVLGVGESRTMLTDDVACNHLAEAGSYIISVFNASASHNSSDSFRLVGTDLEDSAGAWAGAPLELATDPPVLEHRPADIAHLDILEESRRLVTARSGRTPRSFPRVRAAEVEVGTERSFRIPNVDGSDYCGDYVEVTARAVYAGEHGIIWEDVTAPLAGTMDDTWAAVGGEYDSVMHPLILEYFGDPLVFDDRLDGNGRFFMLFSSAVNEFEAGVAGFVGSFDFLSRSQCSASDEAEIFYGRVPTSAASGYEEGSVDEWAWRMRATIIHEVKHITAYATRFDLDPARPNLEEVGLEEASARLAEELYGRAIQGYGQFDNVGYQQSIWCERRVGPAFPDCDPVPNIMGKHYAGLNAYLQSPEHLSPFGRTSGQDWSFYGSGWQLLRWAIDHSDLQEAEFLKALVREPVLTGPANLAARADRPLPTLLAEYTLALATDDHPSGTTFLRSQLTMPSWDTRDIFQGLHDDYAGTPQADSYPTSWPLEPHQLEAGTFTVSVFGIRGGGASIFELSTTRPQLLELRNEIGGTAIPTLGLAIVRVR